jgi:hypothetical protein
MRNIHKTFILGLFILLSCSEEQYEQATVTFYPTLSAEATEPDAGNSGAPVTVNLLTSRVLAHEAKINVRVQGNGAGYGYSYVTYPPQLEPGIVTLTIPAGEKSTLFTFTPLNDGIVEVNDYHYTFTIAEANGSVKSVGQGVFNFTVIEPPLFEANFNDCNGTPAGFTEVIVPGAMSATTWACTTFGYPEETTSAAEANAFGKGGSSASNSYFMMNEPLDGAQIDEVVVKAKVYSRFSGAGTLKLLYSTTYSGTGNPEAEGVTWNEVNGVVMPTAGSRSWTDVEGTISGIGNEQVYIAFQYKGGTTSSASNWRVDNLVIKAK